MLAVVAGTNLSITCARPPSGVWSAVRVLVTAAVASSGCTPSLTRTTAFDVNEGPINNLTIAGLLNLTVCSSATNFTLVYNISNTVAGVTPSLSATTNITAVSCTARFGTSTGACLPRQGLAAWYGFV